MRVLLLAVYNYHMNDQLEEIGIGYIASFLRRESYEVRLLAAMENRLDYPEIVEFEPHIIGLPVYLISKESVYRVCRSLKQKLPSVYICVGGYLPTYHHVEVLEEAPFIDFAVRGEGEGVFLQLIRQLGKGAGLQAVGGLTYRDGGQIVVNDNQALIEDINQLPFPSRDILEKNKLNMAYMSTSRSCTRDCSFCCSSSFWGGSRRKWRGRTVQSIVDEIQYVRNRYGVNFFNFNDSSFEDPGINYKRVQDIAQQIVDRGLDIHYATNFRGEFQRKASPDLLLLLKRSGLCGVFIGLEAHNDDDLRLYNKVNTVDDNEKVIALFRRYDIHVNIGFICFNPYSSFESLHSNIDFLEKFGFASFFSFLPYYAAYKGTGLYEKIKGDGLLIQDRYDDVFGYKYVDPRVEALAVFMRGYFDSLNQGCGFDLYRFSEFYANGYLIMLSYLKKRLKSSPATHPYEAVRQGEEEVKTVLSGLNQRNAHWFRQLLELAQNRWHPDTARQIMEDHISLADVKKIVTALTANKFKLHQTLAAAGIRFEWFDG